MINDDGKVKEKHNDILVNISKLKCNIHAKLEIYLRVRKGAFV